MRDSEGEPKTHLEARQIIAGIDSTGSGTINFADFLRCIASESGDSPVQLFGRIANSQLASTATWEIARDKGQSNGGAGRVKDSGAPKVLGGK